MHEQFKFDYRGDGRYVQFWPGLKDELQKHISFILANIFENEKEGKAYVGRMMSPLLEVMRNKMRHPESKLKYLQYNLHDLNLANILRIVRHWEANGYEKFIKFASSLSFEIYQETSAKCYVNQ